MVGRRLTIMTEEADDIAHLNEIHVNPLNIEKDALCLLSKIRPHWKLESVKIKRFTDGITNQLVGCFPDEGTNTKDAILIRVYGHKTELFIDRRKELANMRLMYRHGLSSPVYCSFANGLAYGYSVGTVLDGTMVRDEFIYPSICRMMAKMHSIALYDDTLSNGAAKKEPCLFKLFHKYLNLLSSSIGENGPDKSFPEGQLSTEDLSHEVNYLEKNLTTIGSPVVFCHNDLLLKNIIYDETQSTVRFIDFEYADMNYQAYDIGNHFNEFAGVDDYKPELYPSKEFQMEWLRTYLTYWDEFTGDDVSRRRNNSDDQLVNQSKPRGTDDDDPLFEDRVEELYIQVSKFALASNLLWGIWSLFQSRHSFIDFDFYAYGKSRINEYFRTKDHVLNLSPSSSPHKSTIPASSSPSSSCL